MTLSKKPQSNRIIVAVGSLNPTKILAVKKAFRKIFPKTKWYVKGTRVASSVADQPMSDKETIKGATTRAKRAISALGADYGVGLEGGMQKIGYEWFETGWIVIINKKGEKGTGSSFRIRLPEKIMEHIHNGKELGIATDIIFKTVDSGKNNGFFGYMTKDTVTRTAAYRDGVIAALSRFVHPSLY